MIDTGFAPLIPELIAHFEAMRARTPLRRSGTPDEVAGVVAWLGSDLSSFVTGTSILVDGGLTALISGRCMSDFSFGQPDGGIIQVAYSVDDLDSSMADYGTRLGTGPWFVMGPFSPPAARYKGEPCDFVVSLAFAFAGHVQIELLQQHNDAPSTLRDRPKGFHHWGMGVRDFDAALGRYAAQGHAQIFADQAPDGGRFAYVDTGTTLPGLIELIEMNGVRDAMFGMMHQASVGWDGSDPIRRMGPAKR